MALYGRNLGEVEITCLIRSAYSRVFFELFGLRYEYLQTGSPEQIREQLGRFDVVLDFAYPAGQLHEILEQSRENISNTLSAMRKGSKYFYMSSIMAYGMPDDQKWIGHYRVPRTSYSYIKREIEKHCLQEGNRCGISIYNFRLGQVHGFLQSVSASFRKKLSLAGTAVLDGRPSDKVNIIFIHSLCAAILDCAKGLHAPGLYTLVNTPQWTLEELYQYYLQFYRMDASLQFRPSELMSKPKRSLARYAIELAKPHRALLETYVLMKAPKFYIRMKGRFRQDAFSVLTPEDSQQPYLDYNLLGTPPLQTISGPEAGFEQTMTIERETADYYHSILSAASL